MVCVGLKPLPDCYSEDFHQLVDAILHIDPSQRPRCR